jgi:predicted dehydrogenase
MVAELRKTIDENRVPLVTTDYESILNDPSIDLVSIVTPPAAHHKMSIQALEKNKHVLCDKPTALSWHQALEMVQASRSRPELMSFIDHELRLLSIYQQMRKIIVEKEHEDKFGSLRNIELTVKIPPQPNQKWTWWQDKLAGGGMLGAVGSHYVDLIHFVTGSKMSSVSGMLDRIVSTLPDSTTGADREVTADHHASVQFRLESGAFGVLHMTIAPHQDFQIKFVLSGSKGTAVFDKLDLKISNVTGTPLSFLEPAGPEGVAAQDWAVGTFNFASQLKQAVESIKSSSTGTVDSAANNLIPAAATFEDGLYTQTILDAVRKSAEMRIWIDIPSEK